MSRKFKITDCVNSDVCYPYAPKPSQGRDARVEIYPPNRLAEGIAFAKEHDIRAVWITGNPSAPFRLILARLKSFPR